MTLAGHSPAHLPQPTHRSRSTRAAIPRTIPTAPTGQTFTQHPQATQAPASTSALRRFFHTVITRLLSVFIHIFAHILPNICRQLLIYLGNKASSVTLQYAGLAFIGLGTDVTSPDWGTLLYQYRSYLFTCPRLVLCPAAAICLLALWFHVLFDSRAQRDEGTIYD